MKGPSPRHNAQAFGVAFLVVVLGGLALWAGLQWVMVWVPTFGRMIPQDNSTLLDANMDLDYLCGVGLAIALAISLLVWPVSSEDRSALMLVWFTKCLITLVMMLYYESYYELDCFGYYYHGVHNTEWVRMQSNGIVDNTCAALLMFIPQSFHATKVAFSMLGMVALFLIYRGGARLIPELKPTAFVVLALFPSVLFFSSTIGKEPIILLAIAFYVYGTLVCYQSRNLWYLVLAGAGIYLGTAIRPWLGAIMLAPIPVLLLWPHQGRRLSAVTIILVVGLGGLLLKSALTRSELRLQISSVSEMMQRTEVLSKSFGRGGSSASEMGESGSSNLAWGMFTALFRPLPGEVMNMFGILASLENVTLIWLVIRCYVGLRREVWRDPLVWWGLIFVLAWTTLYGTVATGNLGATVRFKVQVIPVLLALLYYIQYRSTLLAAGDRRRGKAKRGAVEQPAFQGSRKQPNYPLPRSHTPIGRSPRGRY